MSESTPQIAVIAPALLKNPGLALWFEKYKSTIAQQLSNIKKITIMPGIIIDELAATKTNLLQTASEIRNEDFNQPPFEGSWTPAQVCEHIFKFVSGVAEQLYGPTKLVQRNADENVKYIRDIFLDFNTKMQSPDFVSPGNSPSDKTVMLQSLETALDKIIVAASTIDLTLTCTLFKLPGSGHFTRSEWIWFVIYHTQRHIRQLQNIQAVFAGKSQTVH